MTKDALGEPAGLEREVEFSAPLPPWSWLALEHWVVR